MITRRGFLQTSLVTLALPAAVPLPAGTDTTINPQTRVIITRGCREGELFCSALNAPADVIDSDVGPILQSLIQSNDFSLCLGLTRDSDYVLIGQILAERRYQAIYLGQHQVRPGFWRHNLAADTRVVDALGTELARTRSDWASHIAAAASAIAVSTGPAVRLTMSTPRDVLHAGATQLVSWAFRRNGVAS
jgi:hypothetical protein